MSGLFGDVFRVREIFSSEIMADFPNPHYSKKQVQKAGDALRGQLLWTPETSDQAAEIFKIAYDWRNSHAYPMRRIRQELAGRIKRLGIVGITAARTKRMRSIRKKLAAKPTMTLTQIQDLGGTRAILNSINDMNTVIAAYRNGASNHKLVKDTSYIESPRDGGYRSHHFILSYIGTEEDAVFDGRRIEIQVRTRLQHAWATSVEAVGLVIKQDLKAGEGDKDWLRLFELMSFELAEKEGALPISAPTQNERRQEIKLLDYRLGAAKFLKNVNNAFKAVETFNITSSKFFSLEYDGDNKTVRVTGFSSSVGGAEFYSRVEAADSMSRNTVLVEVDKVENLRAAFPNYYLDVTEFAIHLNRALNNYTRDNDWLMTWKRPRL